jgi:hypothetical protein
MELSRLLRMAAGTAAVCMLLSAYAMASTTSTSSEVSTVAQSSPEAIVEAQLGAYNRRDVEAFLSYYSDDARLFDGPDRLTESGKDQLRIRYTRSFANLDIRATIVKRIVFDRFVIDHERITGRPDGPFEAVAVYEIKDGRISVVTFYKR